MSGRNKVKSADGVVQIEATAFDEAMRDQKRGRAKKLPGQLTETEKRKSRAAKPPTATAHREQMFSIEDAALYMALSEARIRGLIRGGQLAIERVSIAVDEGVRPRTEVRIKKSVLDGYKELRRQQADKIEERKAKRLERVPREKKARQYIAILTPEQVAELQQKGFNPIARFGNRLDSAADLVGEPATA